MRDAVERLEARSADGRVLDVAVAGPADGAVVLFHHGTPGSPLLLGAQIRAGGERGLRHVAYARPGYAGSERAAARTIADCAADAAAVLDAAGAGRPGRGRSPAARPPPPRAWRPRGGGGAGPPAGRAGPPLRGPAPGCSAMACARRRRWRGGRPPTPPGSTGPRGWARRTSRSS